MVFGIYVHTYGKLFACFCIAIAAASKCLSIGNINNLNGTHTRQATNTK